VNAFTDRMLAEGRYPIMPGYKEGGTSKDAAAAVAPSAGTIRMTVLRHILSTPSTADEVAAALGMDILTIRPRVSELRKKEFVDRARHETGAFLRRNNDSGKAAQVWRATDGGAEVLRLGVEP
jgi:predicted ArsR family transcriptional regulator